MAAPRTLSSRRLERSHITHLIHGCNFFSRPEVALRMDPTKPKRQTSPGVPDHNLTRPLGSVQSQNRLAASPTESPLHATDARKVQRTCFLTAENDTRRLFIAVMDGCGCRNSNQLILRRVILRPFFLNFVNRGRWLAHGPAIGASLLSKRSCSLDSINTTSDRVPLNGIKHQHLPSQSIPSSSSELQSSWLLSLYFVQSNVLTIAFATSSNISFVTNVVRLRYLEDSPSSKQLKCILSQAISDYVASSHLEQVTRIFIRQPTM
jgi:hypothetical protein